jgi:hypothetical protein
VIDYLTRYYGAGDAPFQSLSALPDKVALAIMAELADDSPFGSRFKDRAQYLRDRKATERWVRDEFTARGGRPKDAYPITMVLGSSRWLVEAAPDRARHSEFRIPLSELEESDVSFTYPDSMISHWFGLAKPSEFYRPELHGRVFTLPEIQALVAERGVPEVDWSTDLPPFLAPYIEAQVWNHRVLFDFLERSAAGSRR